MKHIVVILFFNIFIFANVCDTKSFSLSTKVGESIALKEIVASLSDNCEISVHFSDDFVEKKLDKKLSYLKIKDLSFKQFLDYLFTKNNIFYSLKNNVLELGFIKTKSFKVDYITTQIEGKTNFTATMNLDSSNSDTGNTLNAVFSFDFWKEFEKSLQYIINTSEDSNVFTASNPIIDKNSGLVTVTATNKQLNRVEKYIEKLNSRMHKQVVIDVRIYSVTLSKSHSTGINWSELSASLNNGTFNGTTQTYGAASTALTTANIFGGTSIFKSSQFSVNGFLNLLATNGHVNSISNPKVTTLNNQKAIINIGQVKNFTFNEVTTDANGNQTVSETVGSKFIGVLLDITPQISDDNIVMMRINPSISDLESTTSNSASAVPDTIEKKLNTVIRVQDGTTIVLGGLITDERTFSSGGIPILKELPVLKYIFGYKEEVTNRRELVFVITPHVINFDKKRTLKDLNYQMPSLGDFY
jgi:general secretion pathway protein D